MLRKGGECLHCGLLKALTFVLEVDRFCRVYNSNPFIMLLCLKEFNLQVMPYTTLQEFNVQSMPYETY